MDISNITYDEYSAWRQGPMFHLSGTPADICTNSTLEQECNTITVNGLKIQSPALLPTCVGALIIGLYCGYKTYQMKTRGRLMYAITFAMTGVMMTFAGIYDCILPHWGNPHNNIHNFFGIVDVGLTSSIGLAFFFDALIDAGIIKDTNPNTLRAYALGMCLIF